LAIYTSDWAATTASEGYRVDPAKVKVVPFGAGLEVEHDAKEIRAAVGLRSKAVCKLLFIGVNARRKGLDLALELTGVLAARGMEVQLTVMGCRVPDGHGARVVSTGFVSKESPEGRETFRRLLTDAHFLLLPSRADCVPVAIAEANAFGVPVIATDVGGITSVVTSGVNGYSFPLAGWVAIAADRIESIVRSCGEYERLSAGAFAEYQRRLNWRVAAKTVRGLLERTL
jgi:glycosyltransferase involved in cell wall biosynthesis